MWDSDTNTLVISQSLEVGSTTPQEGAGNDGNSTVKGLTILSNDTDAISVSLYNFDAEKGLKTVYIKNESTSEDSGDGLVYIEGELTGYGAVIAQGDITIEPESQLSVTQSSSITLYSTGSVNISEISGIRQNLDPDAVINLNSPGNAFSDDYGSAKDGIETLYSFKDNFGHNIHNSTITYGNLSSSSALDEEYVFEGEEFETGTPAFEDMRNALINSWQVLDDMGYVYHSPLGKSYDKLLINAVKIEETYDELTNNGWILPKDFGDDDDDYKDDTSFKDARFRGFIYARDMVNVDVGNNRLDLEGGVVAYGDNSSNTRTGRVSFTTESVDIEYNTQYMSLMEDLFDTFKVVKLYWANY